MFRLVGVFQMDLEPDDAEVISPNSPLYRYLCQAGFEYPGLDDGDAKTHQEHMSKPKSSRQLPLFSGMATTAATLWNDAQHWAYKVWDAILSALYEIDSREFLQAILSSPALLEDDHFFLEDLVNLHTFSEVNRSRAADSLICIVFSALVVFMISRRLVEAPWDALDNAAAMAACVLLLWLALTQLKKGLVLRQQHSLCTLLEVMKDFRSKVKKCLQVIQESEVVARGFTLASHNVPVQRLEVNKLMPSLDPKRQCPELRRSVFHWTRDMFLFWRSMTCDLIESVPLPGELDGSLVYLAHTAPQELSKELFATEEEELNLGTESYCLAAMKSMLYLLDLQQSEFLRRLALSMVPDIKKARQHSTSEVRRVVDQAKAVCTSNLNKLSNAYQFSKTYHPTQGVTSSSSSASHSSLPSQEFHVAVHSLSLHLQAALKRVQAMENMSESFTEDIMADDMRSRMGCLLAEVQAELVSGNTCLEEASGFMERRTKSEGATAENTAEQVTATTVGSDTQPAVTITEGDSPVIVDEVFEALLTDKPKPAASDSDSDYDYDLAAVPKESRAKQTEVSAVVLKELRTVLVLKAKEHQEREKNALARSGLEGEHFDKLGYVIPEEEEQRENQMPGAPDSLPGRDTLGDSSCPPRHTDTQVPADEPRIYGTEESGLDANCKTEEQFPTTDGVDHLLSGDQCRDFGRAIVSYMPERSLFPEPKSIARMAVGKSKLFSPLQLSTFEDCIGCSSSEEDEEEVEGPDTK